MSALGKAGNRNEMWCQGEKTRKSRVTRNGQQLCRGTPSTGKKKKMRGGCRILGWKFEEKGVGVAWGKGGPADCCLKRLEEELTTEPDKSAGEGEVGLKKKRKRPGPRKSL